ncbi:hypothetical protein H6P81_017868 [Aristolochia fimbriata]|uniref:Uncharacterized protein n=1 Tax=Aristolochia fimbriata TaxID=158543 RepID=A0AAV7E183_ARIFI|nr:hypothetical protein H6P81_017868 [Aristolochia fimbriata]
MADLGSSNRTGLMVRVWAVKTTWAKSSDQNYEVGHNRAWAQDEGKALSRGLGFLTGLGCACDQSKSGRPGYCCKLGSCGEWAGWPSYSGRLGLLWLAWAPAVDLLPFVAGWAQSGDWAQAAGLATFSRSRLFQVPKYKSWVKALGQTMAQSAGLGSSSRPGLQYLARHLHRPRTRATGQGSSSKAAGLGSLGGLGLFARVGLLRQPSSVQAIALAAGCVLMGGKGSWQGRAQAAVLGILCWPRLSTTHTFEAGLGSL